MKNRRPELPPTRRALPRVVLRLAVVALVAFGALRLLDWAMRQASTFDGGGLMLWTLALFLIAYMVLIALPFVPGIEIGVSLLMMKGDAIAPFVYGATVGGLSLAFFAGNLVPEPGLRRIFGDLRLAAACRLLDRIAGMPRDRRLVLLHERLPRWLAPMLAGRMRYVTLAALFNLPGNAVIGGGGGIALLAGISRLFGPCPTLLTISLAVMPVPLAVWLWGGSMLGIG